MSAELPPPATRILNLPRAAPGETSRLVVLGDQELRFSTAPCEGCPSTCCSLRVTVSTVDALRLSRGTGRPLLEVVEPVEVHPRHSREHAWPFKLDRDEARVRAVFSLRRGDTACLQLRLVDGEGRCGVYEHRPSLCRLYPFHLEDGEGDVAVGNTSRCPSQWLQDDAMVAAAARDLAEHRRAQALDRQIVRFWNRGRRARELAGFVEWLETTVLPQVPPRSDG